MVFQFSWIISFYYYYELKVNLSTSKTNNIFNVFYVQSLPNTFVLGKSLKLKYLQSILSDTDNFG
jgi:hypothetical protein